MIHDLQNGKDMIQFINFLSNSRLHVLRVYCRILYTLSKYNRNEWFLSILCTLVRLTFHKHGRFIHFRCIFNISEL